MRNESEVLVYSIFYVKEVPLTYIVRLAFRIFLRGNAFLVLKSRLPHKINQDIHTIRRVMQKYGYSSTHNSCRMIILIGGSRCGRQTW